MEEAVHPGVPNVRAAGQVKRGVEVRRRLQPGGVALGDVVLDRIDLVQIRRLRPVEVLVDRRGDGLLDLAVLSGLVGARHRVSAMGGSF
jgi:hypothetical protein